MKPWYNRCRKIMYGDINRWRMMSVLGISKDQYEEMSHVSEHLEQLSKRHVSEHLEQLSKRRALYSEINKIMSPDLCIKLAGAGAEIFLCASGNRKGSLLLDWGGNIIIMDGDPDVFKKAAVRLRDNGFEVIVIDAIAHNQAKYMIAETMGPGYSAQINGRRVDVFRPDSLWSTGSVEFGWHSNDIEISRKDVAEYADLASVLESRGFKISFKDHHRPVEKITPELIQKRKQQAEADYIGAIARGYESVSGNHRRRDIGESRHSKETKKQIQKCQ